MNAGNADVCTYTTYPDGRISLQRRRLFRRENISYRFSLLLIITYYYFLIIIIITMIIVIVVVVVVPFSVGFDRISRLVAATSRRAFESGRGKAAHVEPSFLHMRKPGIVDPASRSRRSTTKCSERRSVVVIDIDCVILLLCIAVAHCGTFTLYRVEKFKISLPKITILIRQ